MSAPDSIQSAVTAVAHMSEMEYVYLLFKLGGIALASLGSLVAFLITAYKFLSFLWSHFIERLRADLAPTIPSIDELKKINCSLLELQSTVTIGFQQMDRRLEGGDVRMNGIDLRLNNLNCGGGHDVEQVCPGRG